MKKRLSGLLLFSLLLATVAVHAATPRTSFPALTIAPLKPSGGFERRAFGMAVRVPDDDGAFPEREPSVLVAVRSIDKGTSLIQASTVVVKTAKPSSLFGKHRGATKKIAKLQEAALAQAQSAPSAAVKPVNGLPKVAVVPLIGRQLERGLAHSMAAALHHSGKVAVMDVDAAEKKLTDLGLHTALAEGTEVDPPLADWAAVLGVEVVAGVRAPSIKVARSAEEGKDWLAAAAVWAAGFGLDFGGQVETRNKQLTYPARGSLTIIVSAGERLAEQLLLWIPEADKAAVAQGTTLGGSRGVKGAGGMAGGRDGAGIAGVGSKDPKGRGIGGVGGANGSGEGAGIAGSRA